MKLAHKSHGIIIGFVASGLFTLLFATVFLNFTIFKASGRVLGQSSARIITSARNENYELKVLSHTVVPTNDNFQRNTVSISLENLTQNTLQLSPGLEMFLQGNDRRQYNYTAHYLAPGQIIGGPLEPQTKTEIQLDFDLPAGVSPTAFIYQPTASSLPTRIDL